jgi:putative ubiquitin-RnfH superfamily antitoxin RatB of RatAB toxin-antitoxin module
MDVLTVTVVWSPGPRAVHETTLQLEAGSTVADALQASGAMTTLSSPAAGDRDVGVWGKRVAPGQLLRDRDRIELYRPLTVDPKVARRERFQKQGSRSAGLFARRRAGAKPGY